MTKPRVEIRPATRSDIDQLFGRQPERTVRAYVALLDGELAGIGGATIERGEMWAFCDMREGLVVDRMTIWRTAKRMLRMIAATGVPLLARPDPERPNARRFLEKLGFEHAMTTPEGETIYFWSGMNVRS